MIQTGHIRLLALLGSPRLTIPNVVNLVYGKQLVGPTTHVAYAYDPNDWITIGTPLEGPDTKPTYDGGIELPLQVDQNGRWWFHDKYDSYTWHMWYSDDNGITWTKSDSLSQRFGNPASSMYKIDLATNRAIMWQDDNFIYTPDITPTATWELIELAVEVDQTAGTDLVHFNNPNDPTKFFIVYTDNYRGNSDYGRFSYVEYDTQLGEWTANGARLWSETVGAYPYSQIALIHNGDGYTPKNGVPDMYFLTYDDPVIKITKAAWNGTTETWDNADVDIAVLPDNRIGRYFTALYSGTELYIIGWDETSTEDANVSVFKLDDSDTLTDISPAEYWNLEVPGRALGATGRHGHF